MADKPHTPETTVAKKFATLEDLSRQIGNALKCAYSGSAKHGSFLRGGSGEYTPCVFMILNDFDDAIKDLKKSVIS